MGMDMHIYIGPYIECDNSLNDTEIQKLILELFGESLIKVYSEGNFNKKKHYWMPNRGRFNYFLENNEEPLEIKNVEFEVERLKLHFPKEIEILKEKYGNLDFKFGVIVTYS